MQVVKCKCGKIFRGTEMKKHISNYKDGEGNHHGVIRRETACVHCLLFLRKGENIEDFRSQHQSCPSGKVTNAAFISKFEGFDAKSVDLDSEEEAEAAVNAIRTAGEVAEDLYMSGSGSDSEEEVEVLVLNPPSTTTNAANTATTSTTITPVATSSPKKGIAGQTRNWEQDIISTHDTQRIHYNNLKSQNDFYKNSNQRLQRECDELKSKVVRIAEFKARILQLEKYETKCGALERKNEGLNKDLTMVRQENLNLQEENNALKGRIRKLEEAKESHQRRSRLHIPLMENRLVDNCLVEDENLDSTIRCYDSDEKGFDCIHLTLLHEGAIEKIIHRRVKKITPRKY